MGEREYSGLVRGPYRGLRIPPELRANGGREVKRI